MRTSHQAGPIKWPAGWIAYRKEGWCYQAGSFEGYYMQWSWVFPTRDAARAMLKSVRHSLPGTIGMAKNRARRFGGTCQ